MHDECEESRALAPYSAMPAPHELSAEHRFGDRDRLRLRLLRVGFDEVARWE
jgi:hypothetical protein